MGTPFTASIHYLRYDIPSIHLELKSITCLQLAACLVPLALEIYDAHHLITSMRGPSAFLLPFPPFTTTAVTTSRYKVSTGSISRQAHTTDSHARRDS